MNEVKWSLEDKKAHSPEHLVTIFVDLTGDFGWAHCTFIDPVDELSLWEYIIPYQPRNDFRP